MGSYLNDIFTSHIDKRYINTIFEVGSRDLKDASSLYDYYKKRVYAFECNPDCLIECGKVYDTFPLEKKENIILIDKAISLEEGDVTFYPFDLEKYDNMGSSSMFKIDFSKRNHSDPDWNRECPQKEITVKGVRLDTFIMNNSIPKVDLICMDLQGYELNALRSLGDKIRDVKYIITEASISNTYVGGANFNDLHEYLISCGFRYVCSTVYGTVVPITVRTSAFSEFDVLYENITL